jgi:hypothetical protein
VDQPERFEHDGPQGRDVRILSSTSRRKAYRTPVIGQHGVTWPSIYVEKGNESLTKTFGIDSIPATFLIDRAATVVGPKLTRAALDAAIIKAPGSQSR